MVKSFFLSAALLLAPILTFSDNVHASTTAAMPLSPFGEERLAIDLGDLLTLEDPITTSSPDSQETIFRKEHFSMTAQLYCAILNTVAHGGYDDLCHLYTDRIAAVITCAPDAEGIHHYTVIEGQAQTVLGTLRCLDTTQLDTLCNTSNATDHIDAKVATDNSSSLLIKLGITYITPTEEALTYANQELCAWSEAPRKDGSKADYYWLKTTTTENSSHDIDNHLSGELWISLPLVTPSEGTTWHTTRDNKSAFQTDIKTTPIITPPTVSPEITPPVNLDSILTQWWDHLSWAQKSGVVLVTVITLLPLAIAAIYAYADFATLIAAGRAAKLARNVAELARVQKRLRWLCFYVYPIFGSLFTYLATMFWWVGCHLVTGS